jgi:hypothetical protein
MFDNPGYFVSGQNNRANLFSQCSRTAGGEGVFRHPQVVENQAGISMQFPHLLRHSVDRDPSSRTNLLLCFDAQDEILALLQANPDGLRAREAIPFSVEKAAIACDHADDLIDRGETGR